MKFELIFYLARQTEENLDLIENGLAGLGQSMAAACATQNPKDLAVVLAEAVMRSQVVFISGGLLRTDSFNTVNVISRALDIPLELKAGYSSPDMKNALTLSGGITIPGVVDGMDGCVLVSGLQTIVLLPDSPASLEQMMADTVVPFLADRYSLQKGSQRAYSADILSGQTDAAPEHGGRTFSTPPAKSEASSVGGKNKQQAEPVEKKKSWFANAMRRPAFVSICSLVILVALGIAGMGGYHLLGNFKTPEQCQETYDMVRQMYGQTAAALLPTGTLEKFGKLYEKNSDVKGWISIPGTTVDYPIVQPTSPDHFYEQRDFNKAANKYGTPYFDFHNNIHKDTGNLIIYGENHGDGAMFSVLEDFQRPEFYIKNNKIQMDTLFGEMKWQVFAVCMVDAGAKETEFNYTNPEEMEQYEFAEFIYQLRMRSLVISDVDVASDDRILTLVTDSDTFAGAQMVVAAVQYTGEPKLIKVDTLYSAKNPRPLMPQKWYEKYGGSPPDLDAGNYLLMLTEDDDDSGAVGTSSAGTSAETPSSATTSAAESSKSSSKVSSKAKSSSKASSKSSSKASSSKRKDDDDSDKPSTGEGKKLKVKNGGRVITGSALDIVARVVEAEMGVSFSNEALKAQAVATYTYILWETNKGVVPSMPMKTASTKTKNAVKAVLGKKMTVNGKTPYTPYFAISAGKTVSNKSLWGTSLSHLVPVDSSWEKGVSGHKVTKTVSASSMKSKISKALGITVSGDPSKWISVTQHDSAAGSNAGYVSAMKIGGSTTSKKSGKKITGYMFKTSVVGGMRSHAFTVEYKASSDNFVITTYGYGHGVGMPQKGAEGMAKKGSSYSEILKHYYTGVKIVNG